MVDLEPSQHVPAASVLKPLYAWVAHDPDPSDIRDSIRTSDNAATDRIVGGTGLTDVLDLLARRTGVRFVSGPTWGTVLVTAFDLEVAYDILFGRAALGEKRAVQVVEHMRQVAPGQRYGAGDGVPVKAGWDLLPGGRAVIVNLVVQRADSRARALCTRHQVDPRSVPRPFAGGPALVLARSLAGDLGARAQQG